MQINRAAVISGSKTADLGHYEAMRSLVAASIVAAVLAGTAGGATSPPKLWVKRLAPVRVAGSGFPVHTRVLVAIDTGSVTRSSWVRATATGQIGVTFKGVIARPVLCHGPALVVTAKAKGIARVTTRLGGSSRDCAPKQPVNQ